MAKYLYGASVQGIQGFIFETNKLREIVGASELVEQICTDMFEKAVNNQGSFNDEKQLIGAAGNIKYLFDESEINVCKEIVLNFPMTVMKAAPGITISQAVVKINGELKTEHTDTLEQRLKIQRNSPIVQHGLGLMITERARKTGKSGVAKIYKKVIDKGTQEKEAAYEQNRLLHKIYSHTNEFIEGALPKDISDIVGGKEKEWIAVIHADGNNLGKLIQNMSNALAHKSGDEIKNAFRDFSTKIEKSTVDAVRDALDSNEMVNWTEIEEGGKTLPFRPIILGGDDLSLIIRGDLALEFTNRFLKNFEKHTLINFKEFGKEFGFQGFEKGITACAGIAFTKPKYPFHYAAALAEHLCSHAKKISKEINNQNTPSSLMFHKVHSSFTENYSEIINRELTSIENKAKNNGQKKQNIRFDFGPYFLEENCIIGTTPKRNRTDYATINQLQQWVKDINEYKAPKSDLRNWVSEISENRERSIQLLNRIKRKSGKYHMKLQLDKILKNRKGEVVPKHEEGDYEPPKFTHIFDVLSISNINKK